MADSKYYKGRPGKTTPRDRPEPLPVAVTTKGKPDHYQTGRIRANNKVDRSREAEDMQHPNSSAYSVRGRMSRGLSPKRKPYMDGADLVAERKKTKKNYTGGGF